jgi:hypothetical protein
MQQRLLPSCKTQLYTMHTTAAPPTITHIAHTNRPPSMCLPYIIKHMLHALHALSASLSHSVRASVRASLRLNQCRCCHPAGHTVSCVEHTTIAPPTITSTVQTNSPYLHAPAVMKHMLHAASSQCRCCHPERPNITIAPRTIADHTLKVCGYCAACAYGIPW